MNPAKKSPGARHISSTFRKMDQAPQIKPGVAQLKTGISAQSVKRPVAPPVYRPNITTPNVAQPKMANGVVNRKLPVAPPVYRPEVKKIVQPKTISQQAKIANSIRPITPTRTASSFSAIQRAEAKKGRKDCFAAVVAKGGGEYPGAYKSGIHAEINALESYLSSGGTLANIKSINLSSSCCKYCYLILSDLGIAGKVVTDDDRDFGSCSGGSYGWFDPDGSVWKAIKKKTGYKDVDEYISYVIERQREL